MIKRLWHRLFGHGLNDLLAHKVLLSSPSTTSPSSFYWHIRCELCGRTVFRVGVPEKPRGEMWVRSDSLELEANA